MNELLQPDAGVDAATTSDLDTWDAEGGAPGVSQPASAITVAAVPKAQRWLLERLGAALVAEWHRLPTPLQRALYDRAVAGDPVRRSARRRRMARFLHDHKSPGQPDGRP